MERASSILLKIATIVGTIVAALLGVVTPLFIILGASPAIHDSLVQGFDNGDLAYQGFPDSESAARFVQGVFLALGIVYAILVALCVANAIISSKARRLKTRNLYIAAIVTGALSTDLSLVGGIFGLIALKRKENKVINQEDNE